MVTKNGSKNDVLVCQQFSSIARTVKSVNVQVDNALFSIFILKGLPERCNGLIVALDALNDGSSVASNFTKEKLLQKGQVIKSWLE